MTPTISSPRNERIKAVRRLQRSKERRATGQTLLEGPHLVEAAIGGGVVPEVVFVAEGESLPPVDAEVITVSPQVLDAIAPTETPQGPIAVIAIPDPAPLQARNTLVLWDVGTPGSVGTLIRSAAAFGWDVATHRGADPWSPKVLRSGAGAHFAVPISRVEELVELSDAGLKAVATVPIGGVSPDRLESDGPFALLVGNEAAGLPADVVAATEASISIPMLGLESLNAAVAGSIALYALSQ